MWQNRLRILIAENQLMIRHVAADTGISRNTISNISNNPMANISNKTLNILCQYFEITPNGFYEFKEARKDEI